MALLLSIHPKKTRENQKNKTRIGVMRIFPVWILVLFAVACAARTVPPPEGVGTTPEPAAGSAEPHPAGPDANPQIDPYAAELTSTGTVAREPGVLKRILVLAALRSYKSDGGDYRLGPGDVLRITVFDLPELNRTVKILDSGTISLPLVGTAKAGGLTTDGLRTSLEKQLGAKYLVNPQVDVFVESYGSQRVAVLGRVDKPGIYPLSQANNRILDVIGQAGGLLPTAAKRIEFFPAEDNQNGMGSLPPAAQGADAASGPGGQAKVGPAGSSALSGQSLGRPQGQQPIVVGLYDLMNLNDPISTLALRSGDVLFVPELGEFFVGGEVKKPGKFTISEKSSVMNAIAEAEGLGEHPIPEETMLIRRLASGETVSYEVDYPKILAGKAPDVPLRPGDQVLVPRSAWRAAVWTVIETLGKFIGIGASATLPL